MIAQVRAICRSNAMRYGHAGRPGPMPQHKGDSWSLLESCWELNHLGSQEYTSSWRRLLKLQVHLYGAVRHAGNFGRFLNYSSKYGHAFAPAPFWPLGTGSAEERYSEGCGQPRSRAGEKELRKGCWEGEKEWQGVQPGPRGGTSR